MNQGEMAPNTLFDAAYSDDVEGIKSAVANGCSVDMPHPVAGHTPLQAACEVNALRAIRVLLALGGDPNRRFTKVSMVDGHIICKDCTPLMYATSVDAAKMLIAAGADPMAQDFFGESVLEWIQGWGDERSVGYLKTLLI